MVEELNESGNICRGTGQTMPLVVTRLMGQRGRKLEKRGEGDKVW